MRNRFFNKLFAILRTLFGHGNLNSINSSFDLLTERGEMAVVVKKEAQQKISIENNEDDKKSFTRQRESEDSFSHNILRTDPEYEFDDESLKKIYEILREIKQFEEKTNKLRHIRFAKRDKTG